MEKGLVPRLLVATVTGAMMSALLGTTGQAALGEAAKVDVAVAKATVGMEQAGENTAVTVSADSHRPVVLTCAAGQVALGLPVDGTAARGVHTSTGATVYLSSSDVDVAVQTLTEGVRALVAIQNADAPHEYRFPLELPEGHQMEVAGDGSGMIEIVAKSEGVEVVVGRVDAPWA